MSVHQILSSPADPRVIATRWFGRASAFNVISDIPNIEELPLSAKLRAAIYRAMTLLPGITLVGPARTLDGRVGTAIGANAGIVRVELIIDRASGGLLGTRTVVTNTKSANRPRGTVAYDLPSGTVIFQQVVERQAITDRPGPPRGEIVDPYGRVVKGIAMITSRARPRPKGRSAVTP
jgi:hypothetical protein